MTQQKEKGGGRGGGAERGQIVKVRPKDMREERTEMKPTGRCERERRADGKMERTGGHAGMERWSRRAK